MTIERYVALVYFGSLSMSLNSGGFMLAWSSEPASGATCGRAQIRFGVWGLGFGVWGLGFRV